MASDNRSLIEPEKLVDEVIVVLAVASVDRPIAQGGHGIVVEDPRGDMSGFSFLFGVRIRLIGPSTWFDASADPESALHRLSEFQTSES